MSELSTRQRKQLHAVLDSQPRSRANSPIDRSLLLEVLCQIQDSLGYIPSQSTPMISEAFNITRADLYGVVSFYDDFILADNPPDASLPEVHICRAEACQAVGARELFQACSDTLSSQMRIKSVYCLGNCALGPAVMVNGRCYGHVDVAKVKQLVSGG